jgi:hypothetical protein
MMLYDERVGQLDAANVECGDVTPNTEDLGAHRRLDTPATKPVVSEVRTNNQPENGAFASHVAASAYKGADLN